MRATLLCDPGNSFSILKIDHYSCFDSFGASRALIEFASEQERDILTVRITIHEEPETVRLKLEGRLTGPWVREFDQTWRSLESSLDSRKLVIDLCGVIHMDAEARRLLTEIYEKTGAEIVADTPMMKYFADEARLQNEKKWGGK